jgi:predicted secreted acid phosphatase
MQVGDNIQDIQGIKQETVDADKLRDLTSNTIVLIPNPMYGSW